MKRLILILAVLAMFAGAAWADTPKKSPCPKGHNKAYSPLVLTTNPPVYFWICRQCGKEGKDQGPMIDPNEYGLLKKFWKGKKAK